MKTNIWKRLLPAGVMLAATTLLAQSVNWWTVAGGGGTSAGGGFSVSGTVGQPAAGSLQGGNYTLRGGFWAGVALVQNPAAPRMSVARLGTNMVVSWPVTADGFVLQVADNLTPSGWQDASLTVQDDGQRRWVVIPASARMRFYQLIRR